MLALKDHPFWTAKLYVYLQQANGKGRRTV